MIRNFLTLYTYACILPIFSRLKVGVSGSLVRKFSETLYPDRFLAEFFRPDRAVWEIISTRLFGAMMVEEQESEG